MLVLARFLTSELHHLHWTKPILIAEADVYSRKEWHDARLWELLILIGASWLDCWVNLCWATVAKWRRAPATWVLSWSLVLSGVSGVPREKNREKEPRWESPSPLMLLFWSRAAHTSALQHLFFYFLPPPKKKETICEVVLHKAEHMFTCLLPTWADRRGGFLFTPRLVSWGALNTCLLWRWGRRAGRRKVSPTSPPRWCRGIKPLIYSDLSSLRGASPPTHATQHNTRAHHISHDGDWNVISPCVSPVWRCCVLTALPPVLSHLPPHILTFLILSAVWWVSAAICRW